ncbi:putative hexosyltransferase MUCI70 [Trifolium repens]|nr:putative hexosyltransferase MUCI70 [Trifolium repens]
MLDLLLSVKDYSSRFSLYLCISARCSNLHVFISCYGTKAKLPLISDVPEGCVILREHVPISNLFTCLWFNEVDRFTSRDQLSFSTVRDKILSRVDFHFNMFLDCERRNLVVQVCLQALFNP